MEEKFKETPINSDSYILKMYDSIKRESLIEIRKQMIVSNPSIKCTNGDEQKDSSKKEDNTHNYKGNGEIGCSSDILNISVLFQMMNSEKTKTQKPIEISQELGMVQQLIKTKVIYCFGI